MDFAIKKKGKAQNLLKDCYVVTTGKKLKAFSLVERADRKSNLKFHICYNGKYFVNKKMHIKYNPTLKQI